MLHGTAPEPDLTLEGRRGRAKLRNPESLNVDRKRGESVWTDSNC